MHHYKPLLLVDSCVHRWFKREPQGQRERRTEALLQLDVNLANLDELLSSKLLFPFSGSFKDPKLPTCHRLWDMAPALESKHLGVFKGLSSNLLLEKIHLKGRCPAVN